MSEPIPAHPPRRQQAIRPQCVICGEATREPIVFGMVRPSLAAGLAAAHPNLAANDTICRKHLTEQRTRYVEQLLERERGELSALERQVVRAWLGRKQLPEKLRRRGRGAVPSASGSLTSSPISVG